MMHLVMKQVLTIITVLFLSSCCCRYGKEDFEFTATHNQLLKPYSKQDTIYFSSKTGDMDTIQISQIDSSQQCGCFMSSNYRRVSVEVKHLPTNKWYAGTEIYKEGQTKILDQNLIVIEKDPKDTEYYVGINYRDLYGHLTDLSKTETDNRFAKYGINKYWTIINETAQGQYGHDPLVITKVYWTEKFGLTAYQLWNGQTYEIVIDQK